MSELQDSALDTTSPSQKPRAKLTGFPGENQGLVAVPHYIGSKANLNASGPIGAPGLYTVEFVLAIRTDTAACGHARLDTAFRDHARSTSVTIGFTLGSTFTVTIGVETLQAAVRGIKSLFDCFRRQPAWLQLLATGALATIVIHPKSRAKLVQAWESAWAAASRAKGPVFEGVLDLIQQLAVAQSDAGRTLGQIQAALPPAQKATAIVHARRICVESRGPVSIDEIVRKMRKEGYSARAKYPEGYLRRVMRKSGQFIEVSPRMFELRA